MKKIVTTVALCLCLGVIGSQLANAGWNWETGNSAAPAAQSDQARQTFFAQTAELRQTMAAKRTAYFNLMNTSPLSEENKAQAKELWQDIFDHQTQLRAMADELGLKDIGPGQACDPFGGGQNCPNGGNGPRNCANGPRNCAGGGCQKAAAVAPGK